MPGTGTAAQKASPTFLTNAPNPAFLTMCRELQGKQEVLSAQWPEEKQQGDSPAMFLMYPNFRPEREAPPGKLRIGCQLGRGPGLPLTGMEVWGREPLQEILLAPIPQLPSQGSLRPLQIPGRDQPILNEFGRAQTGNSGLCSQPTGTDATHGRTVSVKYWTGTPSNLLYDRGNYYGVGFFYFLHFVM